MKGAAVVADILKREGVTTLFGYPRNAVIEAAAAADIRPLIVRQERIGLHMADAVSRLSSRRRIGVLPCSRVPARRTPLAASPRPMANRRRSW